MQDAYPARRSATPMSAKVDNVSQGRRRRGTKWCRIARAICSAFGILSPFLFGQEGALEEGEQFEPAQPDEKQISSFCPKPHVPDWGGQGET